MKTYTTYKGYEIKYCYNTGVFVCHKDGEILTAISAYGVMAQIDGVPM